MAKIIKTIDNPDSIETIEYVMLEGTLYTRDDATKSIHNTSQAKQRIEKLMHEARDEAEEIIQKANLEADEIREQARRSAYEAGQEAATREMKEKLTHLTELFNKSLKDIASLKNNILAQAEYDIVKLSIAIAEKLLCRELSQHPDAIVDIVKEAIKAAENKAEITIRISPDDYAVLRQHMSDLIQYVGEMEVGEEQAAPIRIVEDPDLTPGGCILETDTSLIDMSFESRIEAVGQLLSVSKNQQ